MLNSISTVFLFASSGVAHTTTMYSGVNGVCGDHIGGPTGPNYRCNSGLTCHQYYSAGSWQGVCVQAPTPEPTPPKTMYSGVNGVCGQNIGGPSGPDYVCKSGLTCHQYYSAGSWQGVCVQNGPTPPPTTATMTSGLNGVCGSHIGGPTGPNYVCQSGLTCHTYYSAGAWQGVCVKSSTPTTMTSGLNGVCGQHVGGPTGPNYVCGPGLHCQQYYSAGAWQGVCKQNYYGQTAGQAPSGSGPSLGASRNEKIIAEQEKQMLAKQKKLLADHEKKLAKHDKRNLAGQKNDSGDQSDSNDSATGDRSKPIQPMPKLGLGIVPRHITSSGGYRSLGSSGPGRGGDRLGRSGGELGYATDPATGYKYGSSAVLGAAPSSRKPFRSPCNADYECQSNFCDFPAGSAKSGMWGSRGTCAHNAATSKSGLLGASYKAQSDSGDDQSDSGDDQSDSGDDQSDSGDDQSDSGDRSKIRLGMTGRSDWPF